jgi:hypothetical protein
MNDDTQTPIRPPEGKPLLFISHLHEDKTIADILRTFVISRTANRVAVYQSSSATAEGPGAGGPLNKQLMSVLWRTDVFILLYTRPDEDWSYCTWEYGVALDDHAPDAKPILFQFSDKYPPMFGDLVRVDVRKQEDIVRFTKDLLTGDNFFHSHPGPVTGFQRESDEVKRAGDELYQSLITVGVESDEPEPWPSYPYLQLSLDFDHVDRISDAAAKERVQLTKEVVETVAKVTKGDAEAGRLFGRRAPIENVAFRDLLSRWKDHYPDSEAKWFDAICSQIASAARDEFPTLEWELMRAMDTADGTWYGPALIHTQRATREQSMKFDVCFLKFALDENGRVIAGVPKA